MKDISAKVKDFLKNLAGKLKAAGSGIFSAIAAAFGRIADHVKPLLSFSAFKKVHIPKDKRKTALLCAGGTVFLLILIILFSMVRPSGKAVRQTASGPVLAIPGDELFLGGEPDFVPDFLPLKEPGRPWTAEEARSFWKDPGKGREDIFLEEIGDVIDRLMETVP